MSDDDVSLERFALDTLDHPIALFRAVDVPDRARYNSLPDVSLKKSKKELSILFSNTAFHALVPKVSHGLSLSQLAEMLVDRSSRGDFEELFDFSLPRKSGVFVLLGGKHAKIEVSTRRDGAVMRVFEEKLSIPDPGGTSEHPTKNDTHHLDGAFSSVAVMSHEIRTPLFGIMGTLELLSESGLNVSNAEMVRVALVCCEQLSTVINDILDLSKLEENKMTVERVPFSLQRVIQDSMEVVAMSAQRKGIELIYDMFGSTPELPFSRASRHNCSHDAVVDMVLGDPTRVRQILVNVLSNATKFSDSGEVVVRMWQEVNVNEHGEEREFIVISVQDSGVGIAENAKAQLFQPFQQAEASTSRRYGGSGLGLSISKRMASLMGGSMGFESSEGVGSVFYFSFETEVVQHYNGVLVPIFPAQTMSQLKRVLLGVKGSVLRCTLHDLFLAWGFDVVEVTTREAVLEQLTRNHGLSTPTEIRLRHNRSHPSDLLTVALTGKNNSPQQRYRARSSSDNSPRPFALIVVDSRLMGETELSPPNSWEDSRKTSLINLLSPSLPKSSPDPSILEQAENLEIPLLVLEGGRLELPTRIHSMKRPVSPLHLRSSIASIFGFSDTVGHVAAKILQSKTRERMGREMGLRVLVVEDNPLNQKILKRLLSSLGVYNTETAEDGRRAVEMALSEPFDVVLMDVNMPVMSGPEASRMICESTQEQERPSIVALTADVMDESRQKCLDAGMEAFLGKPVNRDHLWDHLCQVSERKRGRMSKMVPVASS
ncbi:putative histidine kinase [Planoprotostelium fungivorum]|uniref:Putative histidine kinase n=1 Tax=Planoprotostelium fungivorum TaxID=1890364 RepID=A0A2P6NTR2_9EUKA|nr:putative histidine kinase [Planoprotostelium fungivorum]